MVFTTFPYQWLPHLHHACQVSSTTDYHPPGDSMACFCHSHPTFPFWVFSDSWFAQLYSRPASPATISAAGTYLFLYTRLRSASPVLNGTSCVAPPLPSPLPTVATHFTAATSYFRLHLSASTAHSSDVRFSSFIVRGLRLRHD